MIAVSGVFFLFLCGFLLEIVACFNNTLYGGRIYFVFSCRGTIAAAFQIVRQYFLFLPVRQPRSHITHLVLLPAPAPWPCVADFTRPEGLLYARKGRDTYTVSGAALCSARPTQRPNLSIAVTTPHPFTASASSQRQQRRITTELFSPAPVHRSHPFTHSAGASYI